MKKILTKTNRLEKYLKETSLSELTSLYEISITISDICNKKCSWCPRSNNYISPHKTKYIEEYVIETLCKQLTTNFTGLISFAGFGEPTLHPKLENLCNIVNTLCPKSNLIIITNSSNIDKLTNIKISEIYFSEYTNFTDKEYLQLKYIKSPYKIRNIKDQYKYFYNRAGNVYLKNNIVDNNKCCNLPFFKAELDIDGNILLCSSDWKRTTIMGNILKENIYKIWNNNKYKKIRKNLLENKRKDLCEYCNIDGEINGIEFKEFWLNEYNRSNK